MKNTLVISAFPATGKSYFKNKIGKNVLDSDSSKFSWIKEGVRHPDFPDNYIQHIKNNLGNVDLILVSSHKIVREALVKNGIQFVLMYPNRKLKYEYVNRYDERDNTISFVKMIFENWDLFISECEEQYGCVRIEMQKNEYLSDYILIK